MSSIFADLVLPINARIILNTGRKVPINKVTRKIEERECVDEVMRAVNTWEWTCEEDSDQSVD